MPIVPHVCKKYEYGVLSDDCPCPTCTSERKLTDTVAWWMRRCEKLEAKLAAVWDVVETLACDSECTCCSAEVLRARKLVLWELNKALGETE